MGIKLRKMREKLASKKSEGESQTTSCRRCVGKSKSTRFEKRRARRAAGSSFGLEATEFERVADEKFEQCCRQAAVRRRLMVDGRLRLSAVGANVWRVCRFVLSADERRRLQRAVVAVKPVEKDERFERLCEFAPSRW